MCGSRDTPLEYWYQHFLNRSQQILLYQEIHIKIAFWYIISNSFNFSWVLKDSFNKHGYNFDDVSKNGYLRPSENKDIWNKVYNVIISVHDITNKILSRDSNYIVDVALWQKFGNSSFSLHEKCPIRKLFVVRVFPYSNWIRRDTNYLSLFSQNAGKYEPEITPHLDTFQAVFYYRSYHNLNFRRIWPEKLLSLRGGFGLSSIIWDWL